MQVLKADPNHLEALNRRATNRMLMGSWGVATADVDKVWF